MPVPKLLVTIGLQAASMALSASQKISGPRLDDLSFTGADPNTPRPRFWGTYRGSKSVFWAENLREVTVRRKTKGGKFSNFEYYGTWAAEVAAHAIDGVTRIWLDGHLVYDLTGAGPVMPFDFGANNAGTSVSDYITVYLGGEDQEPDPRMEATVDALRGAGSTPAYRGAAYVMFKDIPLANFGNRPPQVIIEAVRNGVTVYPSDQITAQTTGIGDLDSQEFAMSGEGGFFMWTNTISSEYEVVDTAARQTIISGTWFKFGYGAAYGTAISSTGKIWGLAVEAISAKTYLATFSIDGGGSIVAALFDGSNAFSADTVQISRSQVDDVEVIFCRPWSNRRGLAYFIEPTLTLDTGPLAWQPVSSFADLDGNVWAVGAYQSASTLVFLRIYGTYGSLPGYFEVPAMPTAQGGIVVAAAFHFRNGAVDHFVVDWDGERLVTIDLATQGISLTVTQGGIADQTYFELIQPGASTFWIDGLEYSSADLSLVREYDDGDLGTFWGGSGTGATFYEPVTNALVSSNGAGGNLVWRYLDRLGSQDVTLGSITSEICTIAGISAADIDTSLLTVGVAGYGVSQGDGKDWLAPLLDLYDVDPRPDGFLLDFQPRGGAAGTAIPGSSFVRIDDGRTPPFSRQRQGGSDVPRKVSLSFRDLDGEQKPNSASSPPLSDGQGEREMLLDFSSLVLTADDARDLVTRYHRRLEFDAQPATLSVAASQIALQPGDLRPLGFPSGDALFRLDRMGLGADMQIETEWRRDDASVAVLSGTSGAGLDGHVPTEIVVPARTKGFVLDIPLIRDSDDSALPVNYLAAGPYASGTWPGAIVYEGSGAGVDEVFEDQLQQFAAGDAATWGYTSNALGSAAPWVWDRGNVINIVIQSGELTGATEDAIDANPRLNLLLVGQELVQFTTATLLGDGSYDVSGFKRARRGTEWAVGSHVDREIVLLMDQAVPEAHEIADIGTTGRFKAITLGRTTDFLIELERNGASLKPYAPANVTAQKNSAGDWVFTWSRRTRIGAGWSVNEVPLGEAAEAYELDMGDGVSTATKDASAETYIWTAADQITDTGGDVAAGDLEFTIYQMNATVGRGFGASGTA